MTSKYTGETLHYMGAHTDNSFLTTLPNYKNYVLYDAQPNSNYFNIPKDEFINKLIKKFGPIKKMRDENTIEFHKVVSQRTISIVYHINFDCEKEFDISDGDLFISGYCPDWIEDYDFLGRKVYVSCSTVFDKFTNSPRITIEGKSHPNECSCNHPDITVNREDSEFETFIPTSDTLHYIASWYRDNYFLQIFPTYKTYHLYNHKKDFEYHNFTKDKFVEQLIKFYGPITETIDEDTLRFGKIIYHINFEHTKEHDISDGDILIGNFLPYYDGIYKFEKINRNIYANCSMNLDFYPKNSIVVKCLGHLYQYCSCYTFESEDNSEDDSDLQNEEDYSDEEDETIQMINPICENKP